MEIDPGTFDYNKLNDYNSLGVNRISMGVQTLNKEEFDLLGRGHKYDDIEKSVNEIFKSKFKRRQVSIDQIIGVPN